MIENIESPYIHAANTENFVSLVLENSSRGPVLVNFWSRKAGPCLRQYPVLDKIIHDYDGRVLLINVDTDDEFVFTKEYGIKSVPTLKLFRNGQVVETLHGYQSETELKKVLDQYVARDSDLELANAIELYGKGKVVEAYEMIAELIVKDPANYRLPLTMCKMLKYEERYDDAIRLVDSLPADLRNNKEINRYYDLLSFYADFDSNQDYESLKLQLKNNTPDIKNLHQLAVQSVIHENYEQAFDSLVKIIELDVEYNNKYAIKAMLKLFNILGNGHELVSRYRSKLKHYTH